MISEEESASMLSTENASFPIVGIGASAGGLAAFESFFSGMAADRDPNIAFVLVQHLAPDYKSILTELIRRYTRMQVSEVEDGVTVKPNCVYIIPPNRDMAFFNGTLQLLEPSAPRGHRLPIDFFFRSLAQDQHEHAICIILSGTGSDGTLGLRAVKGEGGLVMAQSPDSAEYDGMPRSAIATGLVDFELPPSEMPGQLILYVTHAFGTSSQPSAVPGPSSENALQKIFLLLRAKTRHNFSQYKPSTILRRIARRMAIQQIETIDEYIKYLQQNQAEVEALFHDMLIGVTNFFRDAEAFKSFEEQLVPRLFSGKAKNGIRVWVPGCSTGEEAYSIAILLQEHLEKTKQSYTVQIFATDIDDQAIAVAREGSYPGSISMDVSPERLSRFFTADPDGSSYRIHKNIREMIVFAEQNVTMDPPFSKLDLISCRNLLIYLNRDLQKRIILLFHYALKPGGMLFLGSSETASEFPELFVPVDSRLKLFQSKDDFKGAQRAALSRVLPPMMPTESDSPRFTGKIPSGGKPPLRELTEQAILQQFAPAGALVNAQGDILYLHGHTGKFLELASGEAGINNILAMAREGLRRDLTMALHRAVSGDEIVRFPDLRVSTNGGFVKVNLAISPVAIGASLGTAEKLFLVLLEEDLSSNSGESPDQGGEKGGRLTLDGSETEAGNAYDLNVAALRKELSAKEEYLQATNEELETSNEELKSSNEEMQSVNEELQSTNEELETAKEELQSVNEELATVNTELLNKVEDLSRVNNDMNNLFAGTDIGTIFVDHGLRILRYTPTVTRIINLIPSDVGRPIAHLVSNFVGYDRLVADSQAVLDTLVPKEADVQTTEGTYYTLRILPYRTTDNVIEGAVLSFVDITARRRVEDELKKTFAENQDLLDELQHRAKNSFSMILALIHFAATADISPEAKRTLDDLDTRVMSIAELYDLLYSSGSFKNEVHLGVYCAKIAQSLVRLGNITLNTEMEDIVVPTKVAAPLGLMVAELITNAVKYAFPDKRSGTITMELKKTVDGTRLEVRDDGIGLPAGFDFSQSKGMGYRLLQSLSRQIDSSIKIEGRAEGTRCIVEFGKKGGLEAAGALG